MTEENANQRFRFEKGTITKRPPLYSSEFGLTKSETDLSSYLGDMPSYLERLVGCNSSNSRKNCIFCSFELNPDKRSYLTANGEESFIAAVAEHERLWDNEIVLTFNPNGWHLVNEIIFPKNHMDNETLLESRLYDFLQVAFHQWQRHADGLKNTSVSESEYYHGVVMNLRSGQSITHGHIHCYTSVHPRRDFTDQRIPLFSIETDSWRALSTAVPFDHPRLEFSISEIPAERSHTIPEIASAFALAAKQTYKDLMNVVPPTSLGWFYKPSTKQYTIMTHPMQRRGTVQAFQSDILHKFNRETVIDTLREPLGQNISDMLEQASIEYE